MSHAGITLAQSKEVKFNIEAGKYSTKKAFAEYISARLREAFADAWPQHEQLGEFEFKFKGKPRGKRAEGGAKAPKTPKRKIDPMDFEPEYNPSVWRFNGLRTYIQSVRVVKTDFTNAINYDRFEDATTEALSIFQEWKNLKDTDPENVIFKSKKWSRFIPPVGGIVRNRKTYAIRKPFAFKAWEDAPACAKKLNKEGEIVEGLASWSLIPAIEFGEDLVLDSKTEKKVKKATTPVVLDDLSGEEHNTTEEEGTTTEEEDDEPTEAEKAEAEMKQLEAEEAEESEEDLEESQEESDEEAEEESDEEAEESDGEPVKKSKKSKKNKLVLKRKN